VIRAAGCVVAVGIALLTAACGGSTASHVARLGSTTSTGSPAAAPAASAQVGGWLAFSRCMRSNGVASYPDPVGSGQPPPKESLQQLGVSSSRLRSAQAACGRLLPNGGRPPSQAEQRQVRADALSFSRCVRSHGVPSFPDPDSTGRIPDPASVGVDQGSARFRAANDACRAYRPPYIPSNAAYDAYARSHSGS
jgi:hypothetical protein